MVKRLGEQPLAKRSGYVLEGLHHTALVAWLSRLSEADSEVGWHKAACHSHGLVNLGYNLSKLGHFL